MDKKFMVEIRIKTMYPEIIRKSVEIDDGYDKSVETLYRDEGGILTAKIGSDNFRSLRKSLKSLVDRISLSYDTLEMCTNEEP
jgi:tRNA threonylcarbamoyladenosine modification (KEOPS) complex  Pcc1 subunit